MSTLIILSILIVICLIGDKWTYRNKDIYFVDGVERRFYKMIKPVGSWKRRGCETYALWKPVKSFLWIFWIRRAVNDIWVDMEGFQKFENQPKKRLTTMKLYVNY